MASRIKNQESSAFFKPKSPIHLGKKPRVHKAQTPRKQATLTLKRTRLRRVSKQRREVNVIYQLAKSEFWLDRESKDGYKRCQFVGSPTNGVFFDDQLRCACSATDLHHKKGRAGSNLTNKSTFMGCCRFHHNWCHDHAREARKRKYLLT